MLRDEVEHLTRAWHELERARGGPEIIDFDCAPPTESVPAADSRLEVYERMRALYEEANREGLHAVAGIAQAHVTFLAALLGERPPLDAYVKQTQGCPAAGWTEDYVESVGDRARLALCDLGVAWSTSTDDDLAKTQRPLPIDEAVECIRAAAAELEPRARAWTGSAASFDLTTEIVDVDAYWSYWLDGAGQRVRLRVNRRRAIFTETRARQFAQHELLGHALQLASHTARLGEDGADAPERVRLTSVHAMHQIEAEGLAVAWPLLLTPDDPDVVACVRLDHYLYLVCSELHRAINSGAGISECVAHARARVPFWSEETIGAALTHRSVDPRLRSYLWAYPAGSDWFITLADQADVETQERVLRASYRQPLTPTDLADLWPAGPRIGGPGAPVRLRKPAVP